MGSFSWMCCCGCGREITPRYTQVFQECAKCDEMVIDGQEVVVFMPHGINLVGYYNDYGNVAIYNVNEIDLYGWVGRANEPHNCESMKGVKVDYEDEEFWVKCMGNNMDGGQDIDPDDDPDRDVGIYTDMRYKHKKTGEIIDHDEARKRGWGQTAEFWDSWDRHEIPLEWPIKIAWTYCVDKNSHYHEHGESQTAPNQGFGNAVELDCCGRIVCLHKCEYVDCCDEW